MRQHSYREFLLLCLREAYLPWEQGEPLIAHLLPVLFRGAIGLAAIAGIGVAAFLPPIPAIVLVAFVVLASLWAPYRVWRTTQRRTQELEEERKPRLEVSPEVSRDFLGRTGGEARAFLRVRSTGIEPLRCCYGRIHRLVWALTYTVNEERRISHLEQFQDRDIYFKWQGVGARYHNFHREAILEIARARYGDGQGGWAAHQDTPAPRPIAYFEDYYLSIEIAAENIPSQVAHFRVRLYSKSWKNEDGSISLEPMGTPPHLDFEAIGQESIPDTGQRAAV